MTYRKFASLDELVLWLQQQSASMADLLSPEQRAVTWGDYWVRFIPLESFVLFGQVMTQEDFVVGEYKVGATIEEVRADTRRLVQMHDDNRLFGAVHSVIDPEGSLGFTHRVDVWPITRAQFLEARLAKWEPRYIADTEEWLSPAYAAYRNHMIKLLREGEN